MGSWYGAAANAAGGVIGAAGALTIASAKERAHQYNAKVARQNAGLARTQAERERAIALEVGNRQLGSIRASMGASGLTMEGSFAEIMSESARNLKRDRMEISYQGELQARSYEIEAYQSDQSAKLAKTAGYFEAATSLIAGASGAARYNTSTAPASNYGRASSSSGYGGYRGGGARGGRGQPMAMRGDI